MHQAIEYIIQQVECEFNTSLEEIRNNKLAFSALSVLLKEEGLTYGYIGEITKSSTGKVAHAVYGSRDSAKLKNIKELVRGFWSVKGSLSASEKVIHAS